MPLKMAYPNILVGIEFPEKLGRGEPIKGRLLIQNPNPFDVCVNATATLVWRGVRLECPGCAPPYIVITATHTGALLFPDHFGVDVVPMPAQDATLEFWCEIRDLQRWWKYGEGWGKWTIKYVPPTLERTVLGIPVWTWLIIGGAGVTTTLIYLKAKRRI
jgi:hypothetical protein